MRKTISLNQGWEFLYSKDGTTAQVDVPHTWNNLDGQDGGNDYYRGTCQYRKTFPKPDCSAQERVYLEFRGVNASAKVVINGVTVATHDGGYSTFRADVTDQLKDENDLLVEVDNSVNDRVYPQKADFTFYGGIYRDVILLTVNQHHFDLDYFGGPGIAVTPTVAGKDSAVQVQTWHNAENGTVSLKLLDDQGREVASGEGTDTTMTISDVHLWDGVDDPYL